jgi:outer membrane protein OmpA-like peptidoglycan-associated protein
VKALYVMTGALAVVAGAGGCSTAMPPPELVSARAVYDRAAHGPAAQVDPTDLHTAKESLDLAEQSFERDGDTPDTRDLGYTAERRTEVAEARARAMMAMAQKEQVVAQMHAATAQQAQTATAELGRANQALATQSEKLQSEVERRRAAEKRAAQAVADLARIGSVKQEPRGVVLTLSGSVLFTSGSSTLLPTAQIKLNEVAEALIKQDPDSKMVVEGYTDSQGPAAINQELSQRRAQAVRDYLVSRGIAGDRLTAQGFGPAKPVAENTSAEGRANNRRVEIVVQPTP